MKIRGTVKDAADASPLRGARIFGTIARNPVFDTSTNERGEFDCQDERTQFDGQRIRVRAELPGYKLQEREQFLPRSPGELRLDFTLAKEVAAPVIAGAVRADGEPLEGARVTGSLGRSILFRGITDAGGRFHFEDLDRSLVGQTLTLKVEHFDYASREEQVSVPHTGTPLEIELTSKSPPSIAIGGLVRARDTRRPLSGVQVTGSVGGKILFHCRTDSDGRFRHVDIVPSLAGQMLTLSVEHFDFERSEEQVRLSEKADTLEIKLSRKASKPLLITGVVRGRDTQKPLAGARVTGSVSGHALFECTTDQEGRFQFEHIGPDLVGKMLQLMVNARGYRDADAVIHTSERGATSEIELERAVSLSVPITGQVVTSDSHKPIPGAAVTGFVANQGVFHVEADIVGRFTSNVDQKLVGQPLTLRVENIGYQRFETSGRLSSVGIVDIKIELEREKLSSQAENLSVRPQADQQTLLHRARRHPLVTTIVIVAYLVLLVTFTRFAIGLVFVLGLLWLVRSVFSKGRRRV